jgi:hypothetical protein
MSDTLAAAPAFTVTTHEVREGVKSGGEPVRLTLDHHVTLRRPDRFYVQTTGDHKNDVWYDGAGLTISVHQEKVFSQSRMPETIDRTIDALQERFGFISPKADLLYSNGARAVGTDKHRQQVGRETIVARPAIPRLQDRESTGNSGLRLMGPLLFDQAEFRTRSASSSRSFSTGTCLPRRRRSVWPNVPAITRESPDP